MINPTPDDPEPSIEEAFHLQTSETLWNRLAYCLELAANGVDEAKHLSAELFAKENRRREHRGGQVARRLQALNLGNSMPVEEAKALLSGLPLSREDYDKFMAALTENAFWRQKEKNDA